jgi:hypothetical protein
MTRFLLLSLAVIAACDVGTIPSTTPDATVGSGSDGGNAIVCEQPGINADGHHETGNDCMACHAVGGTGAAAVTMAMGGTAFTTAMGAAQGTATIMVEYGGAVKKFITATGPDPIGSGNFYAIPSELPGIDAAFPNVTVRISLCPNPEKAMVTKIANAADLACSRSGCHGNGTAKIFVK